MAIMWDIGGVVRSAKGAYTLHKFILHRVYGVVQEVSFLSWRILVWS